MLSLALSSLSGSGFQACSSSHLRSVLSAREMAGFLTALLHAALLLQRNLNQLDRAREGSDTLDSTVPSGNTTLCVFRLYMRP